MRCLSRWQFGHWFGLLLVIGSVLRLFAIGEAHVWYDEIMTRWASTLPFDRMVAVTAGDVHPAGYYTLVWSVAHLFGSNAPWLLRLPSALLSIAALPVLALIGLRLGLSDSAVLGGVAIMALVPFQLYYAQEIRMYALLQLLVLLAVLAVLDRRWWLLTLASAAMLWTHNYGFVYCALIYGWAYVLEMRLPILSDRKVPVCNIMGLFVSGVVALFLYLPWMPTLLFQVGNMDQWWQQPTTVGGWLEPFHQLLWGNPLGMLQPISQVVVFAMLALAIWKIVRLRQGAAIQLLVLGVAPMVFSVATELFTHPTYLYRTFIGSSGPLYLLIGWALTEGVELRLRRWATVMLAPLMVLGVVLYYPVFMVSKGATDTFLVEIDNRLQPGDVIYHMNPGSLVSFQDEHPTEPEFWRYVHPAMEGDVGTLSSSTLDAFGIQQVPLEQVEWERAWLIFSAGPTLGIAEDNEAARLVAQYNGQRVLDTKLWYSDLYRGQIWLLTR